MQRITSIRIGYLCLLAAAPLFLLFAPIESWSEESPGAPEPAAEALRLSGAAPLELEEVLRAFSRVMEVPILWDPDDKRIAEGRVVLGHTLSVTRSQLPSALKAVLEVHALKVVPAAPEGPAALRVVGEASLVGHITAYIQVMDAGAAYLVPLLRSQFHDSRDPVLITADGRTNQLIIRADPRTMKHVRKALQHLDLHVHQHESGASLRIVRPKHVPPADLLRTLRPHLRAEVSCVHVTPSRRAPAPICTVGPRGRAIVCTATGRQWERIKDLLGALDTPAAPDRGAEPGGDD